MPWNAKTRKRERAKGRKGERAKERPKISGLFRAFALSRLRDLFRHKCHPRDTPACLPCSRRPARVGSLIAPVSLRTANRADGKEGPDQLKPRSRRVGTLERQAAVNDEQHKSLGRSLDALGDEVTQTRTELGRLHGDVLKAIDGRGES